MSEPTEERDVCLHVHAEGERVVMHFGGARVAWVSLDPDGARELAARLIDRAALLEQAPAAAQVN